MSNDKYLDYVRDVFHTLREAAADARLMKREKPDEADYQDGREFGLIEAMLFMQTTAQAHMLSASELGWEGFDPLRDDLQPELPPRRGSRSR